ncbi:hypothetical protein LOAG_19099, partial [Loa loa]
ESQKEPLDLSMSGMYERRIGASALSAPYVREEQIEFNEIDQNDASSLNASIQEVRREQTSIGNMPKKKWLKRYQNETSNERYQNETSNERYQNETSNERYQK